MTTKELAFEYLMDCFIDWYHYCPVKAGKSVFEIVET